MKIVGCRWTRRKGRGPWEVTTLLQTEGEPSPRCHFSVHISHCSRVTLILCPEGEGAWSPLRLPTSSWSQLLFLSYSSLPPPSPLHSAFISQLCPCVRCDCFRVIGVTQASFYCSSSSVIF